MKKIFNLLALGLFATSILFTSCSKEQKIMETKSIITKPSTSLKKFTLGYLNEDSAFVQISHAQLLNYWKTKFEIDSSETFSAGLEIVEQIRDGQTVLLVRTTSNDGTMNIASPVFHVSGTVYVLSGVKPITCRCQSSACANWKGCDADSDYFGCFCTPCEGDCIKTVLAEEKWDGKFN